MPEFRKEKLSEWTTIRLGGKTEKFTECSSEEEIIGVLEYSRERNIPVQILGGGSNIIFPDDGFEGIVLKINLIGIEINGNIICAKAGENWDNFVKFTINNNFSGLECLSGIPGLVGATPIQNVGAYGVEVGDVIEKVTAIERNSLKITEFLNENCGFSYRNSRFKSEFRNKYIITEVCFRLEKFGIPKIKYPELEKFIGTYAGVNTLNKGMEMSNAVRDAVLKIRQGKSMVSDSGDSDSFSCGSFFTNPVLGKDSYSAFLKKCEDMNLAPPSFMDGDKVKIPAAWLIENSGFQKGYTLNGAGISNKHTLALVNRGGTAKDILYLADSIKLKVFEKFNINLEMEPVLAGF